MNLPEDFLTQHDTKSENGKMSANLTSEYSE